MIAAETLPLRVAAVETLNATLKRFTLTHAEGAALPTGAPGAHILVTVPTPKRQLRNAYSLVTHPEERRHYAVIVRRVAESRGGSTYLHDEVREGDALRASWPTNLFPLSNVARKHLLIAGGIGITPMLSYLPVLAAGRAAFELHHVCKAEDRAAFEALLSPFSEHGTVAIHAGPARQGFDLPALLARQALGTHLYTCGPRVMMDAVVAAARALGWPAGSIHTESFGDHRGGAPFRVRTTRSNLDLQIEGDQSILEALEDAGLLPACLCRGGVCGECITTVLDGVPEHRDDFLDAGEHAHNRVMMICVSRARTPELVLDI